MKHDDDADDGENNLASLLIFVRVENTMHVRHTSRTFLRQNQNYRPIIKAMAHDELINIFISKILYQRLVSPAPYVRLIF